MKEILHQQAPKNITGIVQTIIELPEIISTHIQAFGASLRERRFTEVDDSAIEKAFAIYDRICEDLAYGILQRAHIPQILADLREEDSQVEFLVGLSLERGRWYPLNYPTSLNNGPQEAWLLEPQILSQCYLPVFGQSL